MDNTENTVPEKTPSRRKFVWGLGIFSIFAAYMAGTGLSFFANKTAKAKSANKTVKMLTQDGRLVEIDESLINVKRKKASNTDLQNWIKK
jgi:hypothetical protein